MNIEEQWLLTEKYQGDQSAEFFADCEQLKAGVPLAYIIGHTPFLNCIIHLDSHPLIPRPETEYWTEKVILVIQQATSPRAPLGPGVQVLDLCSGSGAIGVAVAKALPEVAVTFAELDPAHLPTIKKNIDKNTPTTIAVNWNSGGGRVLVVESDLFSNLAGKFDFILSNPPYIDEAAGTVEDSVTAHEPHLALFGGVAGMEIITRIITEANDYLTAQGQLWIEHEPFQSEAVAELGAKHGFITNTHCDQYGTHRYSILTRAVAE